MDKEVITHLRNYCHLNAESGESHRENAKRINALVPRIHPWRSHYYYYIWIITFRLFAADDVVVGQQRVKHTNTCFAAKIIIKRLQLFACSMHRWIESNGCKPAAARNSTSRCFCLTRLCHNRRIQITQHLCHFRFSISLFLGPILSLWMNSHFWRCLSNNPRTEWPSICLCTRRQ